MKAELTPAVMNLARSQAGEILTHEFVKYLKANGVPNVSILKWANAALQGKDIVACEEFNFVTKAYEDAGTLMSTWFDNPEFLDMNGSPVRLTINPGPNSLGRLVKASRKRISASMAIALMRSSPSVRIGRKYLKAVRRVFVLRDFDFTRAAITIPRYLSTLTFNAVNRSAGKRRLIERQCSIRGTGLNQLKPLLQNIRVQGAAFVDSIDGQMEAAKLASKKSSVSAEIGLLVFAWVKKTKN